MKKFCALLISVAMVVLSHSVSFCSPPGDLESLSREKRHHRGEGFFNPWLPEEKAGNIFRLLKWKLGTNPYSEDKKRSPVFPVTRTDINEILRAGDAVPHPARGLPQGGGGRRSQRRESASSSPWQDLVFPGRIADGVQLREPL
jgi:hypothetical protein